MKFEIKVRNAGDKRKWFSLGEFDTRLEVVAAAGIAVSPKMVEMLVKSNKWLAFTKDVKVRVVA